MTKAPLAPPVLEADDPEYATSLRRATLAVDNIHAVDDMRAGELVSR